MTKHEISTFKNIFESARNKLVKEKLKENENRVYICRSCCKAYLGRDCDLIRISKDDYRFGCPIHITANFNEDRLISFKQARLLVRHGKKRLLNVAGTKKIRGLKKKLTCYNEILGSINKYENIIEEKTK